jgi:maleate isomerase
MSATAPRASAGTSPADARAGAVVAAPNYGSRLRIGMILASKNTVAEPDAQAILPAGVSVHTTRLRLVGTSQDDLLGMVRDVEQAADLVASAGVDLIVFHCTAASTVDPEMGAKVVARIEQSTGLPAIATSEALLAALGALRARRIVMLSPYPQAVNDAEVAFFAAHGVEVLAERGFLPPAGGASPSASPAEWTARALAMRSDDADAYFLSCTNIRAVAAIEPLEQALGKPVISSNQAMLWHCLRKGGVDDAIPGYGRLLVAH